MITENPKAAVGARKGPMSVVSELVLAEVGLAMLEGALKYGRHNYRATDIQASTYFDAFRRHIRSWWEGEDIDPGSGLPHITKAIACLVVLRDAQINGRYIDDRPPKGPDGFFDEIDRMAAEIIDRYAGREVMHYTQLGMERDADTAAE